MIKKTIKFVDYKGNEREEDFYFNLSKAELMEMAVGQSGGFAEYVKNIIMAQDNATLVKLFKELILKAYGVKSDDGRRFMKSDELVVEFTQTEAYSNLFMELATNTDEAIAFVNGILPADIDKTSV